MSNTAALEYRSRARQERCDHILRLIDRRFRTVRMIIGQTGWNERSVQRYTARLVQDGLITRMRDGDLGEPNSWYWRYAVTDAGKRAIAGR